MNSDEKKTGSRESIKDRASKCILYICCRSDMGDANVEELRKLLDLGGNGTTHYSEEIIKSVQERSKESLLTEIHTLLDYCESNR